MNILFHCWEYPPRGSGIGQSIFHMSKALREQGCYTVVVTSHGDEGPYEEEVENGKIYRIYRIEDIGKNWISEKLIEISQRHKIDWIEGADHLGETAPLLRIPVRPRVAIKAHYNDVLKVARYAHAHYFWQKPLINLACLKDRKRILREKVSLAEPDVLIAPSQRILDEMQKQHIALAKKQFVVPNPISDLSDWVNKEAKNPTLLLVGRIDIGKGIEYLPDLVEKLITYFPDISIQIAGDDSYARLLGSTKEWLKRRMGANLKYIKFLGQLDRNRLDNAYSQAWVVIVPSNWDTFPTVILEAMLRRKAIVASDNGGMPEMLANTRNIVAKPHTQNFADAIARFLRSSKVRERAGESGKIKVSDGYQPTGVGKAYIEMLSSV